MAPHKRKASELDDAASKQTGGKKRAKPGRAKKQQQPDEDDKSEPFKAYSASDPQAQDGAYRNTIQLMDGFDASYAVKPETWGDIKQYTNVKLQTETFSKGNIIYVCNKDPPPAPPPADLPDSEYPEYERQNFWVGKIVEARATDDRNVYLLVAWLYWPQEIPHEVSGAQAARQYYGQGELVMSNYFDVIDAMTISNKADIQHYDEWDDAKLGSPAWRYWRQSFDAHGFSKNKKAKNLLSGLRSLCKCGKPHNPDKKLWHCPHTACHKWNHNECLIDDIGRRAYKDFKAGKMEDFAKENKLEAKNLTNQLLSPVRAVGHRFVEAVEEVLEEGIEEVQHETTIELHSSTNGATGPEKRKQGRPKKDETGWQGKFDISIVSEENKQLFACVEERSGNKRWEVRVNCLCCGRVMD